MVDALFYIFSAAKCDGFAEGVEGELGSYVSAEFPPDTAPAVQVNDNGEVDKLVEEADVGDVRYPKLIHSGRDEVFGEIGVLGEFVIGLGGYGMESLSRYEKIVFSHDVQYAFMIDDEASAA